MSIQNCSTDQGGNEVTESSTLHSEDEAEICSCLQVPFRNESDISSKISMSHAVLFKVGRKLQGSVFNFVHNALIDAGSAEVSVNPTIWGASERLRRDMDEIYRELINAYREVRKSDSLVDTLCKENSLHLIDGEGTTEYDSNATFIEQKPKLNSNSSEREKQDIFNENDPSRHQRVPIYQSENQKVSKITDSRSTSSKDCFSIDSNADILEALIDSDSELERSPEAVCSSFQTSGIELELQYSWVPELLYRLHNNFKLTSFRPNQLEAINAILSGRDVFVLMPTGGGKSLCYQIPALVSSGRTKGLTIVVSPLLALMEDQVHSLLMKGVKAAMLSSRESPTQRKSIFDLLRRGDLHLVYISPEMWSTSNHFRSLVDGLYHTGLLARFVIDEAHCISNWGHDFRPEYKRMGDFKIRYPDIPLMALTATANDSVLEDIMSNLKLTDVSIFKQSFNRKNLYYEVIPKDKKSTQIIADYLISRYKGMSAIVYCHSKTSCETVSEALRQFGISCHHYHAGMDLKTRNEIQNSWKYGKLQVICATVAFGMGIDKPDVRLICHYTLPRSIESFYQETGRAGRDGKYSHCLTLYSFRDVSKLRTLIQEDPHLTNEVRSLQLLKLDQMMLFCENQIQCRRTLLLDYFGEPFNSSGCKQMCDNCSLGRILQTFENREDITSACRLILAFLSEFNGCRVSKSQIIDVFKGSRSSRTVRKGYMKSSAYGTLKEYSRENIEKILYHMISLGYVDEYTTKNYSGFNMACLKLGSNSMMLSDRNNKVSVSYLKGSLQLATFSDSNISGSINSNTTDLSIAGTVSTRYREKESYDNTSLDRGKYLSSVEKNCHTNSMSHLFQKYVADLENEKKDKVVVRQLIDIYYKGFLSQPPNILEKMKLIISKQNSKPKSLRTGHKF